MAKPVATGAAQPGGFKAGQRVTCRILEPEPGGYAVQLCDHPFQAFLPTEIRYASGETLVAQFVCISNNRILLQGPRVQNKNA